MPLKALTVVLFSVVLGVAWSTMANAENAVNAPEARAHKLPFQAIANGHNLQPRDDQLKSLHIFDLTTQESATVDRLYQELEGLARTQASSVGRRQLVARDAPENGAPTADNGERDRDQELDRKLNICRGC